MGASEPDLDLSPRQGLTSLMPTPRRRLFRLSTYLGDPEPVAQAIVHGLSALERSVEIAEDLTRTIRPEENRLCP